jgi:drug/metabolite transporter (DMT)-like permease
MSGSASSGAGLLKAKLYIVVGALLFSTGGAAIKLSTLSAWQLSCFRSLVGGIALLLLAPAARGSWTWRSLLVAVPYATTFTLFTLANKLTTAANAIFLQDTAPFYILLLSPLLLGERIRRVDIGFMAALVIGLGLIFASSREPTVNAANPELGNVLAACAGLSWALTVLGLRWLAVRAGSHAESPLSAVVMGCFLAFAIGGWFGLPVESSSIQDWLIVVYLGIFQIALAYLFITAGVRHVPAFEASLLLLVEPVFSPVWVWLLLEELPGALALTGGALVIVATAIYAGLQGRDSAELAAKNGARPPVLDVESR